MKNILVAFVLLSFSAIVLDAITEAQIKSAVKMIRNVCQPKSKATPALIDAMHQGEFSEIPELMCYMECVLRMGQIMKEGKISFDSVRAQIASLPERYAAYATRSLESCKDSVKSGEKCTAAYEFYKCMYEASPDDFFLA